MAKKIERVQPFSDLTQWIWWESKNCDRCEKSPEDWNEYEPVPCPIENALMTANSGDWTVSEDIARRMGYREGAYFWPCPEFEKRVEECDAKLRQTSLLLVEKCDKSENSDG